MTAPERDGGARGAGAIHGLNALLLVALFAGSALAYPHLPERIPAHIGVGGEVTRWQGTSILSWYLLPFLTLGTAALNYGIARLLPGRPHLVNLPSKAQLLELPPERRAPVLARVQRLLYGLTLSVILLLAAIQWMMYRNAVGTAQNTDVVVVLLLSFSLTPLLFVVWLPPIQRELRRQVEAHRAEREAAAGS